MIKTSKESLLREVFFASGKFVHGESSKPTFNTAKIAYSSKNHLVSLVGMFDTKISKTCAMCSDEIWVERK